MSDPGAGEESVQRSEVHEEPMQQDDSHHDADAHIDDEARDDDAPDNDDAQLADDANQPAEAVSEDDPAERAAADDDDAAEGDEGEQDASEDVAAEDAPPNEKQVVDEQSVDAEPVAEAAAEPAAEEPVDAEEQPAEEHAAPAEEADAAAPADDEEVAAEPNEPESAEASAEEQFVSAEAPIAEDPVSAPSEPAVAEEQVVDDEAPAEVAPEGEAPAEEQVPEEQPVEESAAEGEPEADAADQPQEEAAPEVSPQEEPVQEAQGEDSPVPVEEAEQPAAVEEQAEVVVAADPASAAQGEPAGDASEHQSEGAGEHPQSPEGHEEPEAPSDSEDDSEPRHESDSLAAVDAAVEGAVYGETGASSSETSEEKQPEEHGQFDGETDGTPAEEEAAVAAAVVASVEGETGADDGAGEESVADEAPVEAEPDLFAGLEGVALLKARAAHEHDARVRELDARLTSEEDAERAHAAAMHETRAAEREEMLDTIEDDEDLLDVALPPHAEEAMVRARAEVDALRLQAQETGVLQPPAFDEVEEDALVIDSISLEDVRANERSVEAARVAKVRDEAAGFLQRLESLKQRDLDAKARTEKTHQALLADIARRKALVGASSSKWQAEQDKAFLKAQTYLAATLETQKRLLTKDYGVLEEVKPIYVDGRLREKPQLHAPRLITLKIDCLRAIKNKLPGGFYVVLVTLYDRLGGHPLRWCTLPDASGYNHFAMTAQPQRHGGKYYNLELPFNQEGNLLTLACPSLAQARPSNVLVFELLAVRGGRRIADRVLAWGAFPLSDGSKSLVRGRFKVPLMRGELNTRVDKYHLLQHRLSTDIDYWLCNLYFEANPIPLRAQFNWTGMRPISVQYKIDTQTIMKGNYFKLNTSLADAAGGSGVYSYGNSAVNIDDITGASITAGTNNNTTSGMTGTTRLSTPNLPAGGEINPFLPLKYQRSGPARGSLAGGKITDSGPTGSAMDEFILPSDLLAGGSASEHARKVAAREKAKELRTYKYSVTDPVADVPVNYGDEKTRFLLAELTADIGFARIATLEFWSTIGMFILTWWLRIYVHYFGQYLWLISSWHQPSGIYEFTVKAWTVVIKFHVDTLSAVITESFVVVIGTVSNQLCFLAMIAFTYFFLRSYGSFSDAGFRFLLAYGINVMFDPVSIVVVDALSQNWSGDYFKIYNAYSTNITDIGYAGAFLTITLAIVMMLISFVLLFYYITQLHMNGRMMDVYHRLHSDEGHFYVPNDLELSVRTLRYILGRSKKWTGFHGTKRKVLVREPQAAVASGYVK